MEDMSGDKGGQSNTCILFAARKLTVVGSMSWGIVMLLHKVSSPMILT